MAASHAPGPDDPLALSAPDKRILAEIEDQLWRSGQSRGPAALHANGIRQPTEHDVLTISSAQVGIAIVVAVTGNVDLSTGPALRAALAEAVDQPGHGPVVVDLSGVTFLGSTGVAVIVDADWEARQRDRDPRLVINRSNTAVIHPLAAAGIYGLLHTFDDVGSAIR